MDTRPPGIAPWVTAIALGALAPIAGADERLWNDPGGGLFGTAENWDDGMSGLPGPDDVAIFDVGGVYAVTFEVARDTDRAILRSGTITFEMDPGASYTLANPLALTPGVVVADDGAATLVIDAGAAVDARYAMIGLAPTAFGALVVEGTNATLSVNDEIRVADEGIGALEIGGGAEVTSGVGAIGVAVTALGEALVTGPGSLWACGGGLTVAAEGQGGLLVEDGGYVACDSAVVGRRFGALGDVVVRGHGSAWDILGSLDVGLVGFGTMLIEDGATVENGEFAIIGTFPWENFGEGGVGIVTVRGAGSVWNVDGDLHVGFLGDGTLVLSRGGGVSATGDVLPAVDGLTRLVVELGDATDYAEPAIDALGTTGDFAPTVALVDGFVPSPGNLFEIVRADGGVGLFAFTLPGLPPDLAWQVIEETRRVALRVTGACGPADVNDDGVVDFEDVLRVLQAWGPCAGCPEDTDGSGVVDFGDVLTILPAWGACK